MTDEPLQLGAFTLGECIGEGGMGKVYRATHRRTGLVVAVKFAHQITTDRERRHFHQEVQAHAGLVHPGVVYLFDYGEVDPGLAAADVGAFNAHSPYVVMELADGGSVRDIMPASSWLEVRSILLAVLDALAFAHARGVVHRDLKPENWLVFGDGSPGLDGDQSIKLADFGLAHAFGAQPNSSRETLEQISGTPYYMAPEQIEGRWRSFGPWTDLYALGCVAWEMICGHPPYGGATPFAIAFKHLSDPFPALDPLFEIPPGVEGWLRRAMATDQSARFQRAADAAWALPPAQSASRAKPQPVPTREWPAEVLAMPTLGQNRTWSMHRVNLLDHAGTDDEMDTHALAMASTLDFDPPEKSRAGGAGDAAEGDQAQEAPSPVGQPPLPAHWRPPGDFAVPADLVDAGLGLFGLREVPFVARDEARDRIWEALVEVVDTGRWRAVIVIGESGTGKSRLVRWMATRAHEVGAVRLLRAHHTPSGSLASEGLAGMVQRHFRSWMLTRPELYEDLLDRLPRLDADDPHREADARGLTEWIHPGGDDGEGPQYHFGSQAQRYTLMERFLRRVGGERLPLVWLDDVHHSGMSLGLIEHLLERDDHTAGGLILATVRSDLLDAQPDLAKRIDDLLALESCHRLDLAEIGAGEHRRLVERMLPLAPDLRDQVVARTEGNPLFAHQLLSHWIEAQALWSGPEGYEIDAAAAAVVPDDIHQLWMQRVERLLARREERERGRLASALEAMAVAGRTVNREEWRILSEEFGYAAEEEVVARIVDHGLARRHDEGWSLAHGLLVDSLARRARDAGRAGDHHRAWAETLEQRYAAAIGPQAWRCVHHWRAAGEPRRALQRSLDALTWSGSLTELGRMEALIEIREDLLDEIGAEPHDEERLRNQFYRSKIAYVRGQADETVKVIEEVVDGCEQQGYLSLLLTTRYSLAVYLRWTGNLEEARHLLALNLALAAELDASDHLAQSAYCMGRIHFDLGEFDEAALFYERAIEGDLGGKELDFNGLWRHAEVGWLYLATGALEDAQEIFLEVHHLSSIHGYQIIANHCLDGLGNVARYQGRFDDGEHHHQRALASALELGDRHAELSARIFLALVALESGDDEGAGERLLSARRLAGEMGDSEYRGIFDLSQLVLDCRARRWQAVAERFEPYQAGWPEDWPLLIDHLRLVDVAAEAAKAADHREWTTALEGFAAALRERLK